MPSSRFREALHSGAFCFTAEIVPPLSADPGAVTAKAMPLKDLVAAVNVTDGAGARTTMSSLAAAALLAQNGFEPVLQLTCRDRNRIALAADLIGAAALGITNVLPLSGDDPSRGDQPDAKPVYDMSTVEMMTMIRQMRDEGTLPSGRILEVRPDFFIGAADIPKEPPPGEPPAVAAKAAAGARFVQTQFCFDHDLLQRYVESLDRAGVLGTLKLLVGVGPIISEKSARWMKDHLFGAVVPDALIKRLAGARDQRAEGRRICIELVQQLRETPGIAGVHVMAPAGTVEDVASLIGECKE